MFNTAGNSNLWDISGFFEHLQPESTAKEFCGLVLSGIEGAEDKYPPLSPECLLGLRVELPLEKIQEIFDQYHVIVLRDPSASESLLVGCGNSPITDVICKGEGHNHEHEEFVTIDPDITKNPTIIGAFGTQESLHSFLPQKHYIKLVNELSSVAFSANEITKNTLDCMAEDFKCYEMKSNGDVKEESGFHASKIFDQNAGLY